MKHQWTRLDHEPANGLKYWGLPTRKCTLCGAEQVQETETWWMRIISRKWRPLIGRCTGAKTP